MKDAIHPRRALHVVLAATVVVVLAGMLAVRLAATAAPGWSAAVPSPAPATVPEPLPFSIDTLTPPCWACPESKSWPVRFRTNLDLLAPLGTGTANAALFFKDFYRPDGPREPEVEAARKVRFEHPRAGMVFPYDHPLVREAEPWCDQATMRYYPDFYPLAGFTTRIPDLLFQLTLARTWAARGYDATDPEAAAADFRRVIRLGRLLRQEDVVVINDLVGLACIRIGAQGIYDLAVKQGDLRHALLASTVLGEVAPQRLLTAARLTGSDLAVGLANDASGGISLSADPETVAKLAARARSDPDRRFRCEAIVQLNLTCYLGSPEQQEASRRVLDELVGSDDEVIAAVARFSRDTRPSKALLDILLKAPEVPEKR